MRLSSKAVREKTPTIYINMLIRSVLLQNFGISCYWYNSHGD